MTQLFTPGPLKARLGFDGRHNRIPIISEAPSFADDANWPYHPLIAHVLMGRGHAPRHVAEATAQLFAAAPDMAYELYCTLANHRTDGAYGGGNCSLSSTRAGRIAAVLIDAGYQGAILDHYREKP